MIQFEPTITLGVIGQTIALIFGIVGWGIHLNRDLAAIKADVSNLQSSNKNFSQSLVQLGNILTQVAVQDNRLLNMEKRVDEMAHGRGFILKESNGSV